MIPGYFSRRVSLASLFVVLILGCGGSSQGVRIEGKLMQGPVAYTVPEGQVLHLAFVGKNAKGEEVHYPADINPADGTFVVGKTGDKVPPGKYRIKISVSVSGTDPASLAKQSELNKPFSIFDGKEFEVTADSGQKFDIETTTGAITKAK